ncbi:hypothetical protein CYD30_27330, partial [Kosakonia cowanii]
MGKGKTANTDKTEEKAGGKAANAERARPGAELSAEIRLVKKAPKRGCYLIWLSAVKLRPVFCDDSMLIGLS